MEIVREDEILDESIDNLPDVTVDEGKVKELEEKLEKTIDNNNKKLYPVGLNKEQLFNFTEIVNKIEWKGKESLGIVEISKSLSKVHDKGIKNDTIFMKALEIEASHYFLNKYTSKGYKEASEFLAIFKSLEQALNFIGADNKEVNDIKTELAAAQQGVKAE